MADLSALLAALKKADTSKPNLSDMPTKAGPDGMPKESDDEDAGGMDAKIVSLLQDQYPTIYRKLSKQAGSEDPNSDPSDEMPIASMTALT